jgi:ferredoxin, 2Fe-2S
MSRRIEDTQIEAMLRRSAESAREAGADDLRDRFAARLGEVAARPEAVPIEFDGRKLEARRGGTILSAAMKNRIRLMHVCGARTLCGTCRVKIDAGRENLTAMSAKEKLSLRYHLSFSPRTRLACQARVQGPIEVESVFPLCGDFAKWRTVAMMSWPPRYRLLSFLITIAVTLTEFLLVGVPLGIIVWLCGVASPARTAEVALALGAIFSLSIAIPTHLWPNRHRRVELQGVK